MPNEFEEHWLSAYLDNELSADERALVEQRLNTDPNTRQLFDDLKRVRNLVATLPGWQGSDLKPAIAYSDSGAIDLAPHAIQGEADGEVAPPTTLNRVDYSTTLAESRLREREDATAMHARRSMRWTTIIAVAAGLATVMLGAPYVFRSRGPVTALHRDSAPEQATPESEALQPESMPPPGAAGELMEQDSESVPRATIEDPFYKSRAEFGKAQDELGQPLAAPGDAEGGAATVQPRSESMEKAEREFKAAESQEETDQSRLNRFSNGAMPGSASVAGSGGMARGGAAASEGAASPSPAPPAQQERSLTLGAEPAQPPAPSEPQTYAAPNLESLAARGAARAAVPSAPPATRAFESDLASRADKKLDVAKEQPAIAAGSVQPAPAQPAPAQPAPAQPAPAQTVPAQVVSARSDAWTDEEVQAAMKQVWYFVAPNPPASDVMAQRSAGGEEVRSGFVPLSQSGLEPGTRTDLPALDRPSADEALAEEVAPKRSLPKSMASDKAAQGKPPSNEPVSGNAVAKAGAAQGPAAVETRLQSRTESPAIGLARLPADQNASAWIERLSQERSLKPLQPLVKNESVVRLRDSTAALSQQRSAAAAGTEKSEPGKNAQEEAKSVVLFVSASEAREILQSLEAQKQEAAQTKQKNPQALQDAAATAPAGELPPAWWKRPQALNKKGAIDAKDSQDAGDEKVILILSQLPPG